MTDHEQRRSLPGIGRRRVTLRLAGYAAAAAFCAVSLCANLRYGLSLGSSPIDQAAYAAASVAADLFKMAAPLLVLGLWEKRFRAMAVMGTVLCLGCVAWSMCSAVGFALSSRGEAVADRKAEAATRLGWEAKVQRAEAQLVTLGTHRPIGLIQTELASLAVAPQIWRRSRQCTDLALEESRRACAPVLGLRKELAAAEAAEHLETQLVAGRAQLATVPVVGTSADPQAGALARLTGLDEATIRTIVALVLASIVEAGSALGFTLVSVATSGNPPLSTPSNPPGSRRGTPPPFAPTRAPGPKTAPRRHPDPPRPTTTDALKRWVQTKLHVDPTAEIPAREACLSL